MQIQCNAVSAGECNTIQIQCSRVMKYNALQYFIIQFYRGPNAVSGGRGNAGLIYEWSATARRPSVQALLFLLSLLSSFDIYILIYIYWYIYWYIFWYMNGRQQRAARPSKLYCFSPLCFLPLLPLLYHHFVIIFVADSLLEFFRRTSQACMAVRFTWGTKFLSK